MRAIMQLFIALAILLVPFTTGYANEIPAGNAGNKRVIVTSNTILSSMISSLLPLPRFTVESILPAGQCPGHYDVKLSDIRKMQRADLNVIAKGTPFADKSSLAGAARLIIDQGESNWMAPASYLRGLEILADGLSKHFPADKKEIRKRKENEIRKVKDEAQALLARLKGGGILGQPVLASSLQKEPLEWMGFRVVGEYGRAEAMSAKDFLRLVKIGREQQVIMVVDNIQSGPDAGKGIAETLGMPHVILTNFPSDKGYLATLGENVEAVLAAADRK